MSRKTIFLTVIESCHPYHKLVGGLNVRKSVELREEAPRNRQDDCGNSCDFQEPILAPLTDL